MRLIRIEYSLNGGSWKANILAKDVKDGVSFLEMYLKAPFNITSTEDICDVHGVSTNILSLFGKTEVKREDPKKTEIEKRGPGRPPKK